MTSLHDSTDALHAGDAAHWERRKPILLSDYSARPFLLDWCEPIAWTSVLDLACGDGHVARQLRRRGAVRVRGFDASPEMVRHAQAREEKEKLGIEYAQRDAADLSSIEAGSIDLVVAPFLFDDVDRRTTAAVMGEVHRVLRPGGRFVFAVQHPSLPFLLGGERPFFFARRELGYYTARNQTLEGRIWRRDGVDVPVRCVHKTVQDYFECLGNAGFRTLPDVCELGVTSEHVELDPAFFGPLRDLPLHLAIRTTRTRGERC